MVAAACFLTAGPALAAGEQPRAWVSGLGADAATCGAITAPCRTLQYSHDNIVAPGGSIYVKDPANFGQIVIRQAISIINDGSGTATILATVGTAVDIQAGPNDSVLLKGMTLDGAGTGSFGVNMSSGGNLVIEDCTIQSFVTGGVYILPLSGSKPTFLIDRSRVIENYRGDGVEILPPGAAIGQIRATIFANNSVGVYVEAGRVLIEDSVIEGLSFNYSYGLISTAFATEVVARRTHFNGLGAGAWATGGATIALSNTVFTNNLVDLATLQSASGLYSYGDNAYATASGPITQVMKQ